MQSQNLPKPAKFLIRMIRPDKTEELIETIGFKFKHYIGNYQIDFGCDPKTRKITHIESGLSVGALDFDTIAAYGRDVKAAAKGLLDKLILKHGAEKILSKIKSAPKI